jgi:hypothetical protein
MPNAASGGRVVRNRDGRIARVGRRGARTVYTEGHDTVADGTVRRAQDVVRRRRNRRRRGVVIGDGVDDRRRARTSSPSR